MDYWVDKWIDRAWVTVIGALAMIVCCLALLAMAGVVWFIMTIFQRAGC